MTSAYKSKSHTSFSNRDNEMVSEEVTRYTTHRSGSKTGDREEHRPGRYVQYIQLKGFTSGGMLQDVTGYTIRLRGVKTKREYNAIKKNNNQTATLKED